jgi:putative ABC transport system permease protein
MTPLPGLAARSLWNRRETAALTVFAIAVSVALLLGVQKLRAGARESFAATISGTDLVVGARSGSLNLLLYSVFRIGDPTSNVSWDLYQKVARHPDVAWTIPLALGDSHRGFRVLGTSADYFRHYRYGGDRALTLAVGGPLTTDGDAVLGSEVARSLGYRVGTPLVISHGLGATSFVAHDGHPLRVTGILAPTGTPVDRTVHLSLGALDAVHRLAANDATHRGLTAFLVGMKHRDAVLMMQRALNEYRGEAVQAVIPGVVLTQLWSIVGIADRTLSVIAAFVALAGLLGMLAMLLAGLNERRRELAILRSIGASLRHVAALLLLEAVMLTCAGVLCGVALAYGLLALARPWIAARYGIFLAPAGIGIADATLAAAVVGSGLLLSAYPAWRAYRLSLADGLTVRL